MKGNLRNTVLLVVLFFISACATSGVGGDVISGKGWQHPSKSKQEQQQDYSDCQDGCEKLLKSKGQTGDSAVFHMRDCEDECMQGKGYVWR